MDQHRTRPAAGRRGHLTLVAGSAPPPGAHAHRTAAPDAPTRRERRVMSKVAARLRRSARGLPESSPLREELLATAEYFELGADPAAEYEDVEPRHAQAG